MRFPLLVSLSLSFSFLSLLLACGLAARADEGLTEADYADHVERLQQKLPSADFHVVLVHEIVHPFMEANFPKCPACFNEGLASLYEQCGDQDGRLWGQTNWRLRGLQAAIQDQRVPSFETLCGTSTHEFYREDPGTNYAQARYLCYHLQQKGLLVKFYHELRKSVGVDPGGQATLARVLGTDDLQRFHAEWQEFVLGLRF